MNALLSSLAKACRENKFNHKLLIVNSYRLGNQLMAALAREGFFWLNLAPVTPLDLAWGIREKDFTGQELEMISDGQALLLVSEILEEMNNSGRLKYFSKLEGADCLVNLLKGTVVELRMAGISSEDIDPGNFVDKEKGRELRTVLKGYEKRLQEEKLLDSAALYTQVLESLRQGGAVKRKEVLYLLPQEQELDFLSFNFLDVLTEGQRIILPTENVGSLSNPNGFYFQKAGKPEKESPFSWLFEVENAPPFAGEEPEVEIFQAYGAACEIKEVFRRLKRESIPADKAVVCYTSAEAYLPLLLTLSSTYNIPLTFADGIPVVFTRPGKLLLGLLSWIEGNYAASTLYRLFTEGALKVSSGINLARLLRRAGIGWGRERYLPCLEALEQGLQADAQSVETEESEGLRAYLASQQEQVRELKKIISFILDSLPLPERLENQDNPRNPENLESPENRGEVNFQQFCTALAEILEAYAHERGSWDRDAGEALREELAETSRSIEGKTPMGRGVKKLKERLTNLRIGASGFEPGHLHVTSLGQGEWSYRSYTFLVGLDDGHFPGSGLQDPVLLERERAALSPNLMSRSAFPQENIYRLNRFLSSRRKGKITFSFSSFDPVEGRASFPAAVLLQVYRLKTGNPQADYSAFMNSLARPASYFPEEHIYSFSEDEWWGSLVLKGKKAGSLQEVRDCYRGLHKGLLAEEARSGERFTIFDGKVCANLDQVDPRQNQRPLSATGIERLATCPFSYFLRYILKVESPEEQIFDPGAWLAPLFRGLLMHRIYAEYLRKICSQTPVSTSESSADREFLTEIAEELIEETKEEIPPPSPVVYEQEKAELLQGLEVFLRAEEELWQEGSIPVYLEVPFGLGSQDIEEAGQGLETPLQVELPDGGIVGLRGRIDRIDCISSKGVYRVWDFKTGSTYGFDEGKHFQKGRQIQHALYGLAAEVILQQEDPKARVEEAGYIFPTEKGEGQRFLRSQGRRQEALEALQKMLDLLSAGGFCATDDKDRCKYCDYQPVCRFPHSVERMKEKLSCRDNAELEPWKELQEYE